MTYDATRESEQLRYLDVDIAHFIQRHQSKPAATSRRTLFLFPGGMGSQLLRARKSYQDNVSQPQKFKYDKVWLTPMTLLGDALKLKMRKQSGGFRDLEDRIVIPNGVVEMFGFTPYSRFTEWCELNDFDWFVFGWDWRRRLEDTVSFFLTQFLPRFRSRVQQECNTDPLQDVVLIGHSFGGMVVGLLLQEGNQLLSGMTRAVTVASPFYGYDGQIHRWFRGEPLLNHIGPFDVTKQVIDVITSFPGCYILPYLDGQTFDTNQSALGADARFPLSAYPSMDALNGAQRVDPFNPGQYRYPTDTGFDMNELDHALQTYRRLADTPPASVAGKFFNLRGVQSSPKTTPGSVSWGSLSGPLNPNAPPVSAGPGMPGDGTLPAWSTRSVKLPSSQCVEIEGDIDHMLLMEHDLTHQKLAVVL